MPYHYTEELVRAVEPKDVASALLEAVSPYGFTCVALGPLFARGDGAPFVTVGWPPGWIDRFFGAGCAATDPVLVKAREAVEPFVWSDAARGSAATDAERALASEARAHGIYDGLAIPVLGIDGSQWIALLGGRPIDLCFDLRELLRLQAVYALHRVRENDVRAVLRPRRQAGQLSPRVTIHEVRLENRSYYERELAKAGCTGRGVRGCVLPLSYRSGLEAASEIHLLALEARTRRVMGCIQLQGTTSTEPIPGDDPGAPRSPSAVRLVGVDLPFDGHESQRIGAVSAVMLAGLQEFALKSGIDQILLEITSSQLPALLELGWSPEPIGRPQAVRDGAMLRVTVEVSEAALRRTRRLLDVAGPVVVRRALRRLSRPGAWTARRLYH